MGNSSRLCIKDIHYQSIIHDIQTISKESTDSSAMCLCGEGYLVEEKCDGGGIIFGREMVGENFFSEILNNGGGGNLEKYREVKVKPCHCNDIKIK